MKVQPLAITHGDTLQFDVYITRNNAVVDITGALFWMTAKVAFTDADPGVFQLTSPAGGITITDAANGKIHVVIPPTATSSLPYSEVTYTYDIQMKETGGAISTVTGGPITVTLDVTRTTT